MSKDSEHIVSVLPINAAAQQTTWVIPAELRSAIEDLYSAGIGGIRHVGRANYPEREKEAVGWVRESMKRMDALIGYPYAVRQAAAAGNSAPPNEQKGIPIQPIDPQEV